MFLLVKPTEAWNVNELDSAPTSPRLLRDCFEAQPLHSLLLNSGTGRGCSSLKFALLDITDSGTGARKLEQIRAANSPRGPCQASLCTIGITVPSLLPVA